MPFIIGALVPVAAWLIQRWVKWTLETVAHAMVESISEQLGIEEMRANLTPQAGAWPNGSTNLPQSLTVLYARQSELAKALEAAITSRVEGGRRWTDPPPTITERLGARDEPGSDPSGP